MLKDQGPGGVGRGGSGNLELMTVTKRQAEEVGKFWSDIWGHEGTYRPNHQALVQSRKKLRSDRKDHGGEVEVMSRNEAWEKAMAKQESWKALGPGSSHHPSVVVQSVQRPNGHFERPDLGPKVKCLAGWYEAVR